MTNNEILQKKWQGVDKQLALFFNKYKKINKKTQDRIQDVMNTFGVKYEELFDYADIRVLSRFRREIEQVLEEYKESDYFSYMARKNIKKSKIKNIDVINFMIYLQFVKEEQEMNVEIEQMFEEIVRLGYKEAIDECNEIEKKKKDYILTDTFIATLLLLPNVKGEIWKEYYNAYVRYCAKEINNQVIINIQQDKGLNVDDVEFQKIFDSQRKRLLNRKHTDDFDKYSGAIDSQITMLFNKGTLKGYEDYGVEQVRFIAEMDRRTTKMCSGLNNQIFKINDWNKYYRYSDEDEKDVLYTTFGLEVGQNLPPIDNHFHYCRSTISYNLDVVSPTSVPISEYTRSQYLRYKKYFGKDFMDLQEFSRVKNAEDRTEWETLKQRYFIERKKYKEK